MNTKIIILGSGESGTGAALLCKKQGLDVFVSDGGMIPAVFKEELVKNNIAFEEGGHTDVVLTATEVVKSPGIPDKNEWVKKLAARNIPIISEIELAYRYKGNSKVVAITGSNGKSTTTKLIWHICEVAGLNVAMVGNIGYSFARQIAIAPKEIYIVEISSFQLDDIVTFRPDIALLLNITEDHLDRYEYQFEKYIASKFRITKSQTSHDYFIYCADDPVITSYLQTNPLLTNTLPYTMRYELPKGAYVKNDIMVVKTEGEKFDMNVFDFAVKGKHNQYNTMAAGLAAQTLGIRKEKIREAVKSFESLEHRMERVLTVRGVDFINDSKSTNVNSTWFALESMTQPTVLILGGIDKGNDYSAIQELVKEKVKAIVCMGLDNDKIHEAFEGTVTAIIDASSAKEAVKLSFDLAEKGDVVLLSPACSSFDLFKNYEDRGRQFKEAVKEL